MSNVATSIPSCASTAAVINTDSVENLGEAASTFFIVSYSFFVSTFKSVHVSISLSFRNMNDATASALCLLVSLVSSTVATVSRTCSCVCSFVTSASPLSLNFRSPFLVHIFHDGVEYVVFPFLLGHAYVQVDVPDVVSFTR